LTLISNFHESILEFPKIPTARIVDSITQKIENNSLTLSEPEQLFLAAVVQCPDVEVSTVLAICNEVFRLLVTEPAFGELCTGILMQALTNFG
jgi:hypothetical protein